MTNSWRRVPTLDEIQWPDEALLICDERAVRWAPSCFEGRTILVTGGEDLKRLASIEELATRVLARRASRPLTLIAMGGGSVGDAVGFLASVLWRGVDLWHVPTTLLAAVDSAHGGKTAVNLGAAKNQLGTFWEASHTIFADSLLAQMPRDLRVDGLTELVKAMWLGDEAGLALLDSVGVVELAYAPWTEVGDTLGLLIDRAVSVKHAIVSRDPRETTGIRTWLNLGHTVAHGLELVCGTSHGTAVAWGLACAALVSTEREMLASEQLERLWRHVFGLLGGVAPRPDRAQFEAAVGRDKKTVDHRLRSVLLRGPADPVVVDDVTAAGWYTAFERVRDELFSAEIELDGRDLRPSTVRLSASKSELNRALVIAALRGDEDPDFSHDSEADDVRAMRAGIAALQRGEVADAHNGGTTFRFLSALAVSMPGGGRIRVGEQLARRPHQPLLDALEREGVSVSRPTDELFEFGPLPAGALHFEVDATSSSQFASALMLLRATRDDVSVATAGEVASEGYLRMTVEMLELDLLDVTPDASSAAHWLVLNALGAAITLAHAPGPLQPDSVLPALLWDRDATAPITLDVGETPDLVPVLAAYAALTPPEVSLVGAPHLRHKESNRIEDLARAFREVGIDVDPLPDGLRIAAGVQQPRAGARFDPRGDHRLAFAAIVLSRTARITLSSPRCVAKSYPRVFEDAWSAGYVVEPMFISGKTGRSPDT